MNKQKVKVCANCEYLDIECEGSGRRAAFWDVCGNPESPRFEKKMLSPRIMPACPKFVKE